MARFVVLSFATLIKSLFGDIGMIRFLKCLAIAAIVSWGISDAAQAEMVVFEFAVPGGTNQAGIDLDASDNNTPMVSGTGFTVTLTASAPQGSFNLNGLGGSPASAVDFGVNGNGGGDTTDAFDADSSGVSDFAIFSFTTSAPATINFVSIDLDRLTEDGEVGSLDVGDDTPLSLTPDNDLGSGVFSVDRVIAPGQQITLSHVSGGGFGLEAITLDVVLTAVPEPTSLLLFGSLMTGFGLRRKRRLR